MQCYWCTTRQLRHRTLRATPPYFDTIQMTHRSQNGAVHAIQPAVQPLKRQARGAQPPCPAHSERCKYGTASTVNRDPGRGDGGFHLVAVLSEAG